MSPWFVEQLVRDRREALLGQAARVSRRPRHRMVPHLPRVISRPRRGVGRIELTVSGGRPEGLGR